MALKKSGELEALLFAAGNPLPLDKLAEALQLSREETAGLLEDLQLAYRDEARGLTLRKAAGGWQLVTKPEVIDVIRSLQEQQELRLSSAAMETLTIIAFKQPVTKAEVEAIRGVKIDGVLGTLTDLQLIAEVGRKEVLGRPILYGTTDKFLTPSVWTPWPICRNCRRSCWIWNRRKAKSEEAAAGQLVQGL